MRALTAPARHYVCVGGSVLEITGLPSQPWRPLQRLPAQSRLTWLLAARDDAHAAGEPAQADYFTKLSNDLATALTAASHWDRAAGRAGRGRGHDTDPHPALAPPHAGG